MSSAAEKETTETSAAEAGETLEGSNQSSYEKSQDSNKSTPVETTRHVEDKEDSSEDVNKVPNINESSSNGGSPTASELKSDAAGKATTNSNDDEDDDPVIVDVKDVAMKDMDKEKEKENMRRKNEAPSASDVEKFDGKIVYNPDGSAYIIDDSGDGDSAAVPVQDGSIVDDDDGGDGARKISYPQIANAIYITRRSAAYYGALCAAKMKEAETSKETNTSDTPIVHSFRVFSLRKRDSGDEDPTPPPLPPIASSAEDAVPVKPILMCFVCKLSFGFSKSFEGHCTGEHDLELTKEEKEALETKNSSAIIQIVGEKGSGSGQQTIVSFLEPVAKKRQQQEERSEQPTPTIRPVDEVRLLSSPPPAAVQTPKSSDRSESTEQTAAEGGESGAGPSQPLSATAIKGLLSAALSGGPGGAAAAEMLLLRQLQQQQQQQQKPQQSPSKGPIDADQLDSRLPLPLRLPEFPNIPTSLPPPTSIMDSFAAGFPLAAALRSPLGPPLPPPSHPGALGDGAPFGPPSIPSNANMLQGTTIGACPDHVNGRKAGVECANCDLILNSSRMPGGLGWNAARNSCKTLKCPKCNWHYKYQETLEIHMKEKHPESETTCIYCITGQQHPRLARGETYTCGYKPYRCEVCNYSTTTKGNLSIHMQSDKHLNNMQELQNGGGLVPSPDGPRLAQSPVGRGLPPMGNLAKQKPNWRCDVCNYETNVARNLRIHMTSEKHTHNIMVLQQNVKHMQQLAQGSGPSGGPLPGGPMGAGIPGLFPGLLPGMDPQQVMGLPDKSPGGGGSSLQPEAAMADMAFLQALMMQMMTGGQMPGTLPGNFPLPSPAGGDLGSAGPMDMALNPENMEPPPEPADPNPSFLFSCSVCRQFGTDLLDQLSQHLTQDRTKIREHEVSILIAGNFICKLCSYKTNLKANFQLHCKTDKHLQRLNHVNHIKEGGLANEWKLKFLNVTNPVQLRCNACDYYTNSLHKLQLHVANQRHEISTILFSHLKKSETAIADERKRSYQCSLCKFSSSGKLLLMSHVRSMKHLQMEQIHQLQKRSEGNTDQTEIGDIFQVVEKISDDDSARPASNAAAAETEENSDAGRT